MQRDRVRLQRDAEKLLAEFVESTLDPAPRRFNRVQRALEPSEDGVLDGCGEQFGLVAVAGIDEALGDAGLLRDLLDRDCLETALQKQPHRGFQEGSEPPFRLRTRRAPARTTLEFSNLCHSDRPAGVAIAQFSATMQRIRFVADWGTICVAERS